MGFVHTIQQLHANVFGKIEKVLDGWFLGLAARLTFSSVLFFFFINSAMTKVGDGLFGIFSPSIGAYAQIIPPVVEPVGYDISQISPLWTLLVIAGTIGEFVLPVLILLGLASRIASLGFIAFIAVMSYVDINFHGLDTETIGAMFDRIHDSQIMDQRLLWLLPLLVIIVKGPGKLSLDYLAGNLISKKDSVV